MTDGKQDGTSPAEDDAALWSLLERAPRPGPVSPYFTRRVLREVAALEASRPVGGQAAPGWLARLWQVWHGRARGVFAGALAAVALLAVGVGVSPLRWHAPAATAAGTAPDPTEVETTTPDGGSATSPSLAVSEPPVAAQDVEIIADLDNLLSREESRLWTDEDTTARF